MPDRGNKRIVYFRNQAFVKAGTILQARIGLFCLVPLLFAAPNFLVSLHGAVITFSGRQLLLAGQVFVIKGVCYQPTPIGQTAEHPPFGDYYTANYKNLYTRDLPLIRRMGANTVRVYGWNDSADHTDFLDQAYNAGVQPVYVLINSYVDPKSNWPDAAVVNNLKNVWRETAGRAKDHPAVLGYAIGNELNIANGNNPAFWSAMNAVAAEIKKVDTNHVVTTTLADFNLIAQIQQNNARVPNLDVWSVQVFRGSTFGGLFADYARASSKPLLISEFGLDAFDHRTGQEYGNNGAPVAVYLEALWGEIQKHTNVVAGGCVFEWLDEWWKATGANTSPATHDSGGSANAGFPDRFMDEEWWGINRVLGGGPNALEPRAAYAALQSLWLPPPLPAVLSSMQFTGGRAFQLSLIGTAGLSYAVQASVDLVGWTSIATNLAPFTFFDTNAGRNSLQFFRAINTP